ncbi:MAG: hypothetical protein PHH60_03720 [Candidatus Margulisbacteria bacterium]|nr:hypothetical protein [Candidatus Margulisiibacteriota bacterium]
MLVFGIAGGKKVRGDNSRTTIRFQQAPKNGNRLESVFTCPGNAQHALYPGQFLEIERVAVEAAFGEPIKISSSRSDFYVLKNPKTSGPPYVLADAPVLFPVTRTVDIVPTAEMTVHDGTFRSAHNFSAAPAERHFSLQNIGQTFIVREIIPSEFSRNEFKDQAQVKALCYVLDATYKGLISFYIYNIEGLNQLIEIPHFGDMWARKSAGIELTDEIRGLIKETEGFRQYRFDELSEQEREAIRRLNRLLIEAAYPQLCPRIRDRKRDGLKISYVSGGNEAIERKTVSQNLSVLSGDSYMFAQVIGKMKIYPGRPSWTFSVLIDPITGGLDEFVFPGENNGGQGVKFVQDVGTRRITSFSFFPNERDVTGFLRYIMECTANFYNRLRASGF